MTLHCFKRRSLLRRTVGGILFASRPPRDQLLSLCCCGAENRDFFSQ
jgi:hypothetical protein